MLLMLLNISLHKDSGVEVISFGPSKAAFKSTRMVSVDFRFRRFFQDSVYGKYPVNGVFTRYKA